MNHAWSKSVFEDPDVRRWLRDRPWIWIVLLLVALMGASIATLVIAQLNRPEIVKQSD